MYNMMQRWKNYIEGLILSNTNTNTRRATTKMESEESEDRQENIFLYPAGN